MLKLLRSTKLWRGSKEGLDVKDGDESEPKKGVADSQQNRDFVLEHKLEVSYI